MPEVHAGVREGGEAAPRRSLAQGVASGGLRTMRDLANLNCAAAIDVLHETIGSREAHAFFRGMSETRKIIVDGQKVGYQKEVVDVPAVDEDLLAEEARLTAELERLRERRKG